MLLGFCGNQRPAPHWFKCYENKNGHVILLTRSLFKPAANFFSFKYDLLMYNL